jgi:hypothetical protein
MPLPYHHVNTIEYSAQSEGWISVTSTDMKYLSNILAICDSPVEKRKKPNPQHTQSTLIASSHDNKQASPGWMHLWYLKQLLP